MLPDDHKRYFYNNGDILTHLKLNCFIQNDLAFETCYL